MQARAKDGPQRGVGGGVGRGAGVHDAALGHQHYMVGLQGQMQFVQHAGADPARVARTFFRVLSWTVGESLAQYGGNGATTWPQDGVAAYQAELAKVDARLAGAGAPDAITRAVTDQRHRDDGGPRPCLADDRAGRLVSAARA